MDLIVSVPELTYLLLIPEGVGEGANLFVALWFILRGGLFCVLPCVVLFFVFFGLLALRLPRLGCFLFLLVCLGRAAVCDCGTPWTFLLLVFVYSTDLSKAVTPVLVLLFIALWFTVRGDLFNALPCVILFLCFSVLLALRLPRLGKTELIFSYFCWICACLVLSVSSSSWCLGKAAVCDCGTPWTFHFSLAFF